MDTKNIANEIQKYLPENRCKYFRKEEATTYHGDVFDHPSYRSYCVKNGEKKELIIPTQQCLRCQINQRINEGASRHD